MSSEPGRSERPPPGKPARSSLSMRDMLGALAVLAVVALVFAATTQSCSFSPGGPSISADSAPVVDAQARLREAAVHTPFALRVPALPAGWRANSTDQGLVGGGGRAVRIGYLSPDGRYLRLVQSNAAQEPLVATEAGGPQIGRGTVEAGGATWVVYGNDGEEPFWVTTVPGAPESRLLITGSGSEQEFRTLASAALHGERLAVGTPPS
ncbi:DUF4245 domain-containing protein [Pseudonocardia hispaniensis]|uniref:DUF4245 domain-containing protein n=1 Tax=Pseudonocardia hispaniensis TaxID=904933 RepID=A0ABW1J0B1_9PSEU